MVLKICGRCNKDFEEIIRGYCRKCYYALKYKGELLNVPKPEINSLSTLQKEMMVGTLLGDANLHRNATSKFAHLKIERSAKDLEYLKYQYDIFAPLCKSGCKIYDRQDGTGQNCYFITRSYGVLDRLYRKWYPNNGKKIVPRNIKLTPLTIAIWLCDDGYIARHHKKSKCLITTFATNGFTKSDTEWLAKRLSDRYKEKFNVYKTSIEGQFIIRAMNAATMTMLKDIKKVMPISMARKLKALDQQ
jgi:hypothetical protein